MGGSNQSHASVRNRQFTVRSSAPSLCGSAAGGFGFGAEAVCSARESSGVPSVSGLSVERQARAPGAAPSARIVWAFASAAKVTITARHVVQASLFILSVTKKQQLQVAGRMAHRLLACETNGRAFAQASANFESAEYNGRIAAKRR